jgi:alpha-ketoglutarate-dependent taurine dioxygenase
MIFLKGIFNKVSKEIDIPSITHRLENDGWVVINQYSEELIGLAENICLELELNISLHNYKKLIPKENNEASYFSLSSAYGLNEFPLHTDGAEYNIPPRFLVLRALSNSPTRTSLVDAHSIKDDLTQYRTRWSVKTKEGKIETNLYEIHPKYNIEFIRFNRLSMKCEEGNKIEICNAIDSLFINYIEWTKSKTIVIDNWRVLHGREAMIENKYAKRIIERLQVFI